MYKVISLIGMLAMSVGCSSTPQEPLTMAKVKTEYAACITKAQEQHSISTGAASQFFLALGSVGSDDDRQPVDYDQKFRSAVNVCELKRDTNISILSYQ